jgi:hypothetical protein
MQEREGYKQSKLPGFDIKKKNSDFACVFLDEERRVTSPQLRLLGDVETIQKERIIPKKNVLFYNDGNWYLQPMMVAKIGGGANEKVTGFVFEDRPQMDYQSKKNRRSSNLLWYPIYTVAGRWREEPQLKFAPWNLESLELFEERDFNRAKIEEIGGKAYGLVRLKKYEDLGFRVPKFFIIPTSFYQKLNVFGFGGRAEEIIAGFNSPEDIMRQNIDRGKLYDLNSNEVPHRIEELFDSLNFRESIFDPIISKKILDFTNGTNYGVLRKDIILRSSSPLEDNDKNAYQFQGVFRSEKGKETVGRVYGTLRDIYLSSWSAYAESYLRNRKLVGKVDRDMAVIVQEVPEDYKFVCRVFYKNGEVSIEYISRNLFSDSKFVGLKAVVNSEGKIIKREDEVEDHFYKDIFKDKKMPDEDVTRVADLMRKLSEVGEYGNDFSTEILAGGVIPYVVQIRRSLKNNMPNMVPDFDSVDRNRIIVDFTAETNNFSIGRVEGPMINLTGYESYDYTGTVRKTVYNNLDEYYEKAKYYNDKYPGAIFVVDMDFGSGNLINEKFHMLTSNKGGLITCHRYDTSLRCPHFISELYNDPCFHVVNVLPEPFKDIETGTVIGVISSGQKARFYYPE